MAGETWLFKDRVSVGSSSNIGELKSDIKEVLAKAVEKVKETAQKPEVKEFVKAVLVSTASNILSQEISTHKPNGHSSITTNNKGCN